MKMSRSAQKGKGFEWREEYWLTLMALISWSVKESKDEKVDDIIKRRHHFRNY